MKNILYLERFGKAFVPKSIRPDIRSIFEKAGYQEVPYQLFGAAFWLSAVVTYFVYVPFVYPLLQDLSPLYFFLLTFAAWGVMMGLVVSLCILVVYTHLNLRIYHRTQQLEEKLPEYLTLVSVNLKGGMSFEKALWHAIRPEFDILAKEITLVSKRVMTGRSIEDALQDFAEKYDSAILQRSMDLLVGEIRGGGKIVDVIDNLVKNLKRTKRLRRELHVSTQTYAIFLTVIVVIVAPALFAISLQLLDMMTGFTQQVASAGSGGGGFADSMAPGGGGQSVDKSVFRQFSYVALSIIAIFSSMIVSIINRGNIVSGLKYIPIFWASSLFMYIICLSVAQALFSGLGM